MKGPTTLQTVEPRADIEEADLLDRVADAVLDYVADRHLPRSTFRRRPSGTLPALASSAAGHKGSRTQPRAHHRR